MLMYRCTELVQAEMADGLWRLDSIRPGNKATDVSILHCVHEETGDLMCIKLISPSVVRVVDEAGNPPNDPSEAPRLRGALLRDALICSVTCGAYKSGSTMVGRRVVLESEYGGHKYRIEIDGKRW